MHPTSHLCATNGPRTPIKPTRVCVALHCVVSVLVDVDALVMLGIADGGVDVEVVQDKFGLIPPSCTCTRAEIH